MDPTLHLSRVPTPPLSSLLFILTLRNPTDLHIIQKAETRVFRRTRSSLASGGEQTETRSGGRRRGEIRNPSGPRRDRSGLQLHLGHLGLTIKPQGPWLGP